MTNARKVPTKLVVITGCSGGGKSTLLGELEARGYKVFSEPGRLVVKGQLASGGDGVPWDNVNSFIKLCVELAIQQRDAAVLCGGLTFFDRGIVDAVANLEHLNLPAQEEFRAMLTAHRYHSQVFMTPPWPEIYVVDNERRHNFAEAVCEFEMLVRAYGQFGYDVVMVPKSAVGARADFILERLNT